MSSLVDLPEHVALRVLSRLDSRDLHALGASCRAFRERMHHDGLSLVEAGAAEAVAARGEHASYTVIMDSDVVLKRSFEEWVRRNGDPTKPVLTATWLA